MTVHPDPQALAWDKIALEHSGARQLIRYATAAEERRYREIYSGSGFNCLPVIVSREGDSLRYHFLPFETPRGARPALPNAPRIIADIDAGRGVIICTMRGLELRGYQAEWTREGVEAAFASVTLRGGEQ